MRVENAKYSFRQLSPYGWINTDRDVAGAAAATSNQMRVLCTLHLFSLLCAGSSKSRFQLGRHSIYSLYYYTLVTILPITTCTANATRKTKSSLLVSSMMDSKACFQLGGVQKRPKDIERGREIRILYVHIKCVLIFFDEK